MFSQKKLRYGTYVYHWSLGVIIFRNCQMMVFEHMLQLRNKHTLLHKIKHKIYSPKLNFIMIKFKTVPGIDAAQVNVTLHALVVCPALSFFA